MTESEWLACSEPTPMLIFLNSYELERKTRLFACACCRRVWHEMKDERCKAAVVIAELHAEGLATESEMERAAAGAHAVWDADNLLPSAFEYDLHGRGLPLPYSAAAYNATIPTGWWGGAPAFVAPYEIILEAAANREVEAAAQCALIREIFGSPFHTVVIDPAWLDWQDETILKIAQTIYDTRDFSGMPILADALEDAGCTDAALLAHCREPGDHVRGCWALDLVLGKA
jgi:hypothetical protein